MELGRRARSRPDLDLAGPALCAVAHPNPYPPPAPRGRITFAEVWRRLLAAAGLVGCAVLLMRPELRSIEAWLVAGGAAGIVPLDRVLDRFGMK